MIITTEELEVLARGGGQPDHAAGDPHQALIKGGTEAQKQHWLPQIAAGQVMAAVSVTEPDTGSTSRR
jgi:(2S)-methylsuccinyl-CoA dehydrogenase